MAIIGIQINRENPEFTWEDFIFWMPQFKKYVSYYNGKILVGSSMELASVYSTDYSLLTIGDNEISLISADEIIYTGSMTIGPIQTEVTYNITLDTSTNILTLNDGTTTTTCTLKSEGLNTYNQLYNVANHKIFKSIYGTDWQLAMSLCIAHYLTLIADQLQAPSGNTLQGIAGGGVTKGVLASMQVGAFSKTYSLEKTMVGEDEAMFWNQTSYGAELMALLKTKGVPSIMVITSNPIPGAN